MNKGLLIVLSAESRKSGRETRKVPPKPSSQHPQRLECLVLDCSSKTPSHAPLFDSTNIDSLVIMNSNFTASKQINTGETPLPYTASPWKLLVGDLRLVLKFFLYIPSMFRPLRGANGPIDELSPTRENKIVILVHVILSLYQTTFLISLPVLGFWMPVPAFVAYIVLAYWVNEIICRYTLNTGAQTLVSTHPLVPRKCHSHERWIFLNGITVG